MSADETQFESDDITGEPVQPTDATTAEKARIESLIVSGAEPEISFYQYSDDWGVWGHRMELSTHGVHIVPDDITAITDNTDWSFIGCEDESVMFEGPLPDEE